jgi:hypothetical protein
VLICTGNDIGPRSTSEIYFCNVGLFLGAIINANIFGELAVLVAQMNTKATMFQEKLTAINTAIKNLNCPLDMEDKIRDYIVMNYEASES